MTSRRRFLGLLGAALVAQPAAAQLRQVARVSVLSTGTLLLNGKRTSLAELDLAFKKLKLQDGVVWYYRENAQAEPPAEATAVVNLIIENQLPVSMSTKPDFSDYVDGRGQSKPRPQ